jgi:hypothetical protein
MIGRRMLKRLLMLVLLALSPSAGATTYYIDNCVAMGKDSNNGTAPSTPWLTVSRVNASTLLPGDSVLFQRTCTWREPLTPPSGGSSAAPITFGAYGSGALPALNGSSLVTGWTLYSGSIYYASVSWNPNLVFQDGTSITPEIGTGAMGAGTFYYDSGTSRLYVWAADSDSPAIHTIEASHYGATYYGLVFIYNLSYITIDSLHLTKYNYYGVEISGTSSNITVQNSNFDYGYQNDITTAETTATYSNISVLNNTFGHGGIARTRSTGPGAAAEAVAVNGFGFQGGSIKGNTIGPSPAEGIQVLAGAQNVEIASNSVSNTLVGIYVSAGYGTNADTQSITVRYNKVYNSSIHNYEIALENGANINGVDFYDNISDTASGGDCLLFGYSGPGTIKNAHVYDNTFVNCNNGVEAFGPTSDATNQFKNNIISVSGSGYPWVQQDTSESNYSPDYNLLYKSGSSTVIRWLSATYTLGAFQSGKKKMMHSISADPRLTNTASGDYSLLSTSPAIGTGTNLGATYQLGLDPRSGFPWTTLNQNSYGTAWEIGAFIFLPQNRPAPPTSLSATVD